MTGAVTESGNPDTDGEEHNGNIIETVCSQVLVMHSLSLGNCDSDEEQLSAKHPFAEIKSNTEHF